MKRKCTGTRKDGQPCARAPIAGALVCRVHGGAAPQVAAKAAVRAEVMRWGLGDTTVSPEETLLRLISQSSARAERLAVALEEMVEQHGGNLAEAMVGDSYVTTADGGSVKVGEYIRGLVALEAQERDRLAGFCAKAIAAGLAKRQVELAEKQASIAERALMAALEDIGLSVEQRQAATARLVHHLRAVG